MTDSATAINGATRLMAAGLVALTFAFIPGMANPFVVGKEGLLAVVTSFTLLIVALDRVHPWPEWPAWWFALPAAAFALACASAEANEGNLLASNGAVRVALYGAFLLSLRFGCAHAAAARWLAAVVASVAAAEACIIVIQVTCRHVLLDTTGLPSSKWTAFGTLGNPNWAGGYLAAALPLALWLALEAERRTWWIAATLIAVALGATLSRGAWLAAAVATAVVVVSTPSFRGRLRAAFLPVTAVVIGIGVAWASYGAAGVLTDVARTGSIEGRMRMWRVTASMIADRPGLGWGVGRFASVYPGYQRAFLVDRDGGPVTDLTDHPHNEYLYCAVESGAAGVVIALAGLVLVVSSGMHGQARDRLVPWAAGLVAVAVHATVDVPLHLPVNAALSCFLLAGFVATATIDPRRRNQLGGGQRAILAILSLLVMAQAVRLIVVERAARGARGALAVGEPAAAIALAEEGLWLEPASGELLTLMAQAQAAGGQIEPALASARRAAVFQPGATLSYLIAELELRRENPIAAADELRTLAQTLPGLLLPHIRLAEIYAWQGELEPAKLELRRALAQPSKISNLRESRLRERASARLRELEAVDAGR